VPPVNDDPVRLLSVQQYWMQKQVDGWVAADGLSDEAIVQELEERARRLLGDTLSR
jgi:hypothetical protein